MAGTMLQAASCLRRRASRVEASQSVYALWTCDGHEDVSRIRDVSLSGLFIESPIEKNLGAPVKLHFLADEGQIRAAAVVCHVRHGEGLGLKLTAINIEDRQRLARLIRRLEHSPEVGHARTAA